MADYSSVYGLIVALENYLKSRLPTSDDDERLHGARVEILGNSDLKEAPTAGKVTAGIYLHRISIDPHGRGRYLQPSNPAVRPRPELPVNLHILLIGWAAAAEKEVDILAWAMQQIGGGLQLDSTHLVQRDPRWGDDDVAQIIPEDMSTEDLLRIWENLPSDYVLSTPYIIKTARLQAPDREQVYGRVGSIIMPSGDAS